MKKIVTLLVLFFAVTFSANAQQENSIDTSVKKDVYAVTEYIKITPAKQKDLQKILFDKYRRLEDKTLSDERKNLIAESTLRKIKSIFDSTEIQKLEANPELLNRLIK